MPTTSPFARSVQWVVAALVTVLASGVCVAPSHAADPEPPWPLRLTTSASGTRDGQFDVQPVVEIVDDLGNVVDSSAVVTAIAAAPGHLTGTTSVTAAHGEATFTDLGLVSTQDVEITFTATLESDGLAHFVSQSATSTADPTTTFWSEIAPAIQADVAQVFHTGCPTPVASLAVVRFPVFDSVGMVTTGALVVNQSLTSDIVTAFHVAFQSRFRFTEVRRADLVDALLMSADITSGFNCRYVLGTKRLSYHSYGLAIDVNPRRNPYTTHRHVYPANRWTPKQRRRGQGVLTAKTPLVRTLRSLGWCWGGTWRLKDWQHFEKNTPGCRSGRYAFTGAVAETHGD